MKCRLLTVSFAIVVPEEWPADLTLETQGQNKGKPKLLNDPSMSDHPRFLQTHDEDLNRVTHKKLDLPNSAHAAIREALDLLESKLDAIHPEIDVAHLEIR